MADIKTIAGLLGNFQPQPQGLLGALEQNPAQSRTLADLAKYQPSGMMGYGIRQDLYPGEQSYFKENPNVSGMASESGHVILNPHSPPNVNMDSVARNEALRLYMRDHGITPSFDVTPEQQQSFAGTSYGSDPSALRQTLAARIYSGDPSAKATEQQRNWLEVLLGGAER